MSSPSHLDERSFEQLLAAAYALQLQQRRPVLVPSSAKAADVLPTSSQRKTVQMAVGKSVGAPMTAHTSGVLARKGTSAEVDEAARLAAIAETHTAVHKNNLGLPQALQLIASSASNITKASATAIWLVQSGSAVCRAATGTYKDVVGQHMEIATSRWAACLQRGEVLRIWNAQTGSAGGDSGNDMHTEASAAGTSLLAVPIHHEGKVEGVLEVVFPRSQRFSDADLRTCQILSGLVSEAMALASGQEWKHVLDSERATLLQALDLIQPHLARLLNEAESKAESPRELRPVAENSSSETRSRPMAKLGEYLLSQQASSMGSEYIVEEEAEEGGSEADARGAAAMNPMEPEDAESWRSRHQLLQEIPPNPVRRTPREVQTALNLSVAPSARPAEEKAARFGLAPDFNPADIAELKEDFDSTGSGAVRYTKLLARTNEPIDHIAKAAENLIATDTDIVDPDIVNPDIVESNAIDEDGNLVVYAEPVYSEPENLAKDDLKTSLLEFWAQRWADVCLAVSAAILAISLVWAFWPNAAPPGRSGAQPALTPFEQLLVAVGLAELPPPVTVYAGSPNAQVWVDMRTALYYCGGSVGYGKTEKGKFLAQRDAQYEQFQPASGRACD